MDILVDLRSTALDATGSLSDRLAKPLGADVHLVPLQAAQRDPQLMDEVLRDGRLLVDRKSVWSGIQAKRDETHRLAASAREQLREEARDAVDYFRRLDAKTGDDECGDRA